MTDTAVADAPTATANATQPSTEKKRRGRPSTPNKTPGHVHSKTLLREVVRDGKTFKVYAAVVNDDNGNRVSKELELEVGTANGVGRTRDTTPNMVFTPKASRPNDNDLHITLEVPVNDEIGERVTKRVVLKHVDGELVIEPAPAPAPASAE